MSYYGSTGGGYGGSAGGTGGGSSGNVRARHPPPPPPGRRPGGGAVSSSAAGNGAMAAAAQTARPQQDSSGGGNEWFSSTASTGGTAVGGGYGGMGGAGGGMSSVAPAPAASGYYGTSASAAAPAAPAASSSDPFGYSGGSSQMQMSGGMTAQQSQGQQQGGSGGTTSNLPYSGAMFNPTLSGPMGGQQGTNGTSNNGPIGSSTNSAPGSGGGAGYSPVDYENEPPILEELGINLAHIGTKSRAVVLPFSRYGGRHLDRSVMDDSDLAGPLVFALLLGGELLLSGKVSFGYIYGFGLFGCFALALVLNLMSPNDAISVWTVTSILGYALLPVNALAGINALLRISRWGVFGVMLAAIVIIWCTVSSTRLFEGGCGLRDQRYLVAYPVALIYSAFVIITIF